MSIPAVYLFPIHGHQKLRSEGYRTRDGHVIEWLAKLAAGPVRVYSRPEPWVRRLVERPSAGRASDPANVHFANRWTVRMPTSSDRSRWWIQSLNRYPVGAKRTQESAVIVWNPMLGLADWWPALARSRPGVHLDLLDDWTVHYAFGGLRAEVEESYRRMFRDARTVTANSEGTLALAHRFGRRDSVLLTNGVDPERFTTGRTGDLRPTVGYVGKLGTRIDIDLVLEVAAARPDLSFTFAGPVLDGNFDKQVRVHSNITWLGDVHYEDMPGLLQTFDVGWVPHRVGEGEVGGDVIKTYEYRAAGLPVLATPIAGIRDRGLADVIVLDRTQHAEWLRNAFTDGKLPQRSTQTFDADVTWRAKTEAIADMAEIPRR